MQVLRLEVALPPGTSAPDLQGSGGVLGFLQSAPCGLLILAWLGSHHLSWQPRGGSHGRHFPFFKAGGITSGPWAPEPRVIFVELDPAEGLQEVCRRLRKCLTEPASETASRREQAPFPDGRTQPGDSH